MRLVKSRTLVSDSFFEKSEFVLKALASKFASKLVDLKLKYSYHVFIHHSTYETLDTLDLKVSMPVLDLCLLKKICQKWAQ